MPTEWIASGILALLVICMGILFAMQSQLHKIGNAEMGAAYRPYDYAVSPAQLELQVV